MFLHNLDVVHPLGTFMAAANIFQITGHIALTVKIIRLIAETLHITHGHFRHLARFLCTGQVHMAFFHNEL